jgi:hypothetical protein
MDEICEGEKIVRHSTSAIDTVSLLPNCYLTFLIKILFQGILYLSNKRVLVSASVA